ncbi:hypothetical protein DMN91_004954 [Ooceraea biroi]|uniref:Activating signal cointegrator 1 complex subunit n=1 Tax=Ooceraea biroi TaxID=2015173 RepID=A0A3L8DQW0_OOCBI|nr:hypothetical protein DMN91_004954 [Ooceraea biroi]
MKFYENPDCVPLEELQLNIKNDGVVMVIRALNAKWADKRILVRYEAPEIYKSDGSEIEGARERWLEIAGYIIEDLSWLLELPFYRFWSNVVYNTSIIDTLVSFLQEAPPFYALESFPNIPEMLKVLEDLCRNVLMVFARLVTNKESSTEYMSLPFFGSLLYDNYIFTIPIIFDLCQLYGRENAKVTKKVVHNIFSAQSMYNDDLKKSVPCLIKALENVERRFGGCLNDASEAVALPERSDGFVEMTLCNLEDLILYTLDVSSTLAVLLRCYSPVVATFHRDDFMNKIISFYGSTIPEMYKKLDKLAYNDDSMPKYMELKHRLDVTRVELLNLYRIIVYEPILNIQEKINTITESEIREYIDAYLDLLMNAISEKEFIMDYHQFYPINCDLETISKLYPEIDTIKREYILQLLSTSIGNDKISTSAFYNNVNEFVAGSSGMQNNQQEHSSDANCTNNKVKSASTNSNEQCLTYYNNDVASVIDAVIENKLPPELKEIDRTLPYIPPDTMEQSAATDLAVSDAMSVFNNEFDIPTLDDTRIYRRKKKNKYGNANEILNDKSEINESRSIYDKYSIIDDYDDEYDDTYDSHNIGGNAQDDSTEVGVRPFTIPRILRANDKNNTSSEDDVEVEEEKPVQNNDHFIQNPAELRAKAEQRRQSTRRNGNTPDVVGKTRGKGQDKSVLTNRHKKNVHKDTHGNHNRRMGSQIKKRQGMIPS